MNIFARGLLKQKENELIALRTLITILQKGK